MAEYLVELYVSKAGAEDLRDAVVRARAAAEEVTREGTAVRCLRSIFVPEDETHFLLYEAASAAAVAAATTRAGMDLARIAEAVDGASPAR